MKEENFFKNFNIDPLEFDRSGLKWKELKDISLDYGKIKGTLGRVGKSIVGKTLQSRHVHSINYRIKKDEHLIEKIIRKKIKSRDRIINRDNYRSEITDLIGIRALHLFKEDWIQIHRFIKDNWDFIEEPTAYIRNGDSQRIIDYYGENQCRILEHPYGYRSVHYTINTEYRGKKYPVEIQVRTIFEEAWGEIDHVIRYPYYADDEILFRLSSILNRISGSADELGTYLRYLKSQIERKDELYLKDITEKNSIIQNLKEQINALSIEKEDKSRINKTLNQLETDRDFAVKTGSGDEFPWLESFMNTPLFRNISSRIEDITKSSGLAEIQVSPEDMEAMKKAQSELLSIINNPEELKKLLSQSNVTELLEDLNNNQ